MDRQPNQVLDYKLYAEMWYQLFRFRYPDQ